MLSGVRELDDRKDAIEERSDGLGASVDADPGAEAGKIAQSAEDAPRVGAIGLA